MKKSHIVLFVFLAIFTFSINKVFATTADSCAEYSEPTLILLSPNGGEIYKEGQKIEVKWLSCNLSKKAKIYFGVQNINTGHGYTLSLSDDKKTSTNTGKAKIILPTITSWQDNIAVSEMEFGSVYRLVIGAMSPYKDTTNPDSTDAYFSIEKDLIKKPVVFKKCKAGREEGSYVLDNKLSLNDTDFSGGDFLELVNVANISLENEDQKVCVNGIQLGVTKNPKNLFSKIQVFDSKNKVVAKVFASDFVKDEENNIYTAWVPVKVLVKKDTREDFVLMASMLPKQMLEKGVFQVGFSGLNFSKPGAVGNSSIYGNKVNIK